MKKVVDAIIIDPDLGILLTRKKDTWILPGGKMNDGESEIDTLSREIGEELHGAKLDKNSIIPYKSFNGKTPFSGKQVEVKTYFAQLLTGALSHSAEIEETKHMKDFGSIKLSAITQEIISTLIMDGYIK